MAVLHKMTELVALMARGGEAAEGAARALKSVSAESRAAALGAGAVLAVLPYMRAGTPPQILTLAAQTFSNLCRRSDDTGAVELELVSPALPLINDLLQLDDRDVLEAACVAVRNITDGPSERTAAVLAVPGLTARLVALMSREPADVRVQVAALTAVENMLSGTDSQAEERDEAKDVSEDEGKVKLLCMKLGEVGVLDRIQAVLQRQVVDEKERCLDAGCLDPLVRLLQSREPALVEGAACATCIILKGTETRRQRALEKGILTVLRGALEDELLQSYDCLLPVAGAITFLCGHGSVEQRARVVASGVLAPYCKLLTRPENLLVRSVMHGLQCLLDASTPGPAAEALSSQLRGLGLRVMLLTLTLTAHDDERVNVQATYILELLNTKNM